MSGPFDDDFDPTHPSVWLIPSPARQAMVLAGMVKLAPIHHLWLEQRFSGTEPDRSLAGWSMLPIAVAAGVIARGRGPIVIVIAAVVATMTIVAPTAWTTLRRRRILRDHGLRQPDTVHTRFAPEDYPIIRLAELGLVIGIALAVT